MKKIKLLGTLVVMITVMACEMPQQPVKKEPPVEKETPIIFEVTERTKEYADFNCYTITGIVKNTSDKTIYYGYIVYTAYANGVIIDTASDYLYSLRDLHAGASVTYKVIFLQLKKGTYVDNITYEIEYLVR